MSSGAKAANQLDEVFGIRTVDDLLRHYPRKYTEGAAVRGDEDERPEEGRAHHLRRHHHLRGDDPDEEDPKKKIFRITLGSGRSKVTATFFNANYIRRTSPRAPG